MANNRHVASYNSNQGYSLCIVILTNCFDCVLFVSCSHTCSQITHYINSYTNRTQSIYDDCEHFTELFNDLNVTNDYKYNEWVLKLFFQSSDENTRKRNPITPFKEGDLKFIADPNTIATTTEQGIPFK